MNHRAALGANTIGFTLQQFHLVPYLSITKNMMALTPNVVKVFHEHTVKLIELYGFSHCTEYTPEEIRADKRQRTDVAHIMLNRLRLLMADKSTGNLDMKNAQCSLEYPAQFTTEREAELLLAHGPDTTERTENTYDLTNEEPTKSRHAPAGHAGGDSG